jgi:hypothetical protein
MADAENAHGVVFESEQDTIISEAGPEVAGPIAVQRIHVAGTEAENPFKQAHGGRLIHCATSALASSSHSIPYGDIYLSSLKILGFQSELSEDVLHRNPLAVLGKPGLPVVKALAVLLGYWFIVGRRRSQGVPDGIEQHELQEASCGWDL